MGPSRRALPQRQEAQASGDLQGLDQGQEGAWVQRTMQNPDDVTFLAVILSPRSAIFAISQNI